MQNHTLGVPGGVCGFTECGLPYYSLGYCIGHYRQQKRGRGMRPLRRRGATLEARFWAKVDKTEGCWIWTGNKLVDGYGRISIDGRLHLAHRVSFTWANGEILDGMVIDHRCHNPACVRPDHLRATTVKQNMENRQGATRVNTTGVRGVTAIKTGYTAQVNNNGRQYYVGKFDSVAEAEAAVMAKRLELFTHNDADRLVTQ